MRNRKSAKNENKIEKKTFYINQAEWFYDLIMVKLELKNGYGNIFVLPFSEYFMVIAAQLRFYYFRQTQKNLQKNN